MDRHLADAREYKGPRRRSCCVYRIENQAIDTRGSSLVYLLSPESAAPATPEKTS